MEKHNQYERYVRQGNNKNGEIKSTRSIKKTNPVQKRRLIFMLIAFFIERFNNIADRLDSKLMINFGLDYPGSEIFDFIYIDLWFWDLIAVPLLVFAIVLWIRSLKYGKVFVDEKGHSISED